MHSSHVRFVQLNLGRLSRTIHVYSFLNATTATRYSNPCQATVAFFAPTRMLSAPAVEVLDESAGLAAGPLSILFLI